jgi:hypothetical protein
MNPASRLFSKLLPLLPGLLSLVFLLHAAGILSKDLGLTHDELWDFIPAVGMLHGDSLAGSQEVTILHRPVPLVTGPYQGALKTWVLGPLLVLSGTSPRMLLTLNVLFAMAYLAAVYWAILPIVGHKWAWIIFASPFVDTNFLLTGPMDYGPSLFQYIFIGLTMGGLFRYVSGSELKYLWLTGFFTGCILAQKLTALPFVISFVVLTAVFSCRHFVKAAASRGVFAAVGFFFVVPAVLFCLPLIPHLIYFYNTGFANLFSMTADGVYRPYFYALLQNFLFVRDMFGGTDWYQRITLHDIAATAFPTILATVLIAVSLGIHFLFDREKKFGKYLMAGIALGACSFLLYPAFRGLDRPWHFYLMTPFVFTCCAIATSHCLSFLFGRFKKNAAIVPLLFSLGLAAAVALCTAHGLDVLSEIKIHKGACMWSPAIYEFYDAVKAENIRSIDVINYSIAYPLYVMSNASMQVEDMTWTKLTPEKLQEMFDKVRANPAAGIAYRYCRSREGDASYIQILNRDPEINEFLRKLDMERSSLRLVSRSDQRQTEFVLIHR